MSENESQKNAPPLVFDAQGLIPVIAQDHLTGEVRMFAFASTEAVLATLATKRATFFSRSRAELWEKGRTSGHTLAVKRVYVDCDTDALIYAVEPNGPTCHTSAESCFFQVVGDEGALERNVEGTALMSRLEARLEARRTSTAEKSYTKSLYEGGPAKIGEKIREEADEVARAIEGESDERVASEAADVVYHLLVGLRARGIAWRDVLAKLEERLVTSGHAEKASRTE
ncbi:MAG: bifunctional phosphoribosyl-AMP cyclohydrolase/phosphoribosyl-ATP diphosphatase HisIE [Polyangiaceae bacterium]